MAKCLFNYLRLNQSTGHNLFIFSENSYPYCILLSFTKKSWELYWIFKQQYVSYIYCQNTHACILYVGIAFFYYLKGYVICHLISDIYYKILSLINLQTIYPTTYITLYPNTHTHPTYRYISNKKKNNSPSIFEITSPIFTTNNSLFQSLYIINITRTCLNKIITQYYTHNAHAIRCV